MSTTYTGDPSAVSNALSATISGATNASPIVVATTSTHGFATGDTVVISGVTGNTAANGEWQIVVTDATHFSLTGSTGSGAYAGGGTAVDVSLTPGGTIPSDGDDETAASVDVMLEMLANRTQFLGKRVRNGTYRLVDISQFSFSPGGTWTASAFSTANSVLLGSLGTLQVGDVVEISAAPNLLLLKGASSTTVQGGLRLEYQENGGSITAMTDGSYDVGPENVSTGTVNQFNWSLAINSTRVVAAAGVFDLYVNGYATGVGGPPSANTGQGACVVKVWRPN